MSGRCLLFPLLLSLLVLCRPVTAADRSVAEAQVKAVYIYNFASFVRWPNDSSAHSSSPFLICAIGNDEVSSLLPGVLEGESVSRQPLHFRQLGGADNPSECKIIYFAEELAPPSLALLTELAGQPVLTVSQDNGFARAGGHIELSLKQNRVHPIINRTAANASGLRVSSQLYRLSTVIVGSTQR
jgi:hypothetical protein